jgi:hypothetical protein
MRYFSLIGTLEMMYQQGFTGEPVTAILVLQHKTKESHGFFDIVFHGVLMLCTCFHTVTNSYVLYCKSTRKLLHDLF